MDINSVGGCELGDILIADHVSRPFFFFFFFSFVHFIIIFFKYIYIYIYKSIWFGFFIHAPGRWVGDVEKTRQRHHSAFRTDTAARFLINIRSNFLDPLGFSLSISLSLSVCLSLSLSLYWPVFIDWRSLTSDGGGGRRLTRNELRYPSALWIWRSDWRS